MANDVEMMSSGDSPAQLDDLIGGELDDPSAPVADHVVVRVLPERMLVVSLLDVETHLLENPATDEPRQRSVDGGLAHFVAPFFQQIQDLLRLEVILKFEHGVKNLAPRTGILDPVVLQILAKCLLKLLGAMEMMYVSHKLTASVQQRAIPFTLLDGVIILRLPSAASRKRARAGAGARLRSRTGGTQRNEQANSIQSTTVRELLRPALAAASLAVPARYRRTFDADQEYLKVIRRQKIWLAVVIAVNLALWLIPSDVGEQIARDRHTMLGRYSRPHFSWIVGVAAFSLVSFCVDWASGEKYKRRWFQVLATLIVLTPLLGAVDFLRRTPQRAHNIRDNPAYHRPQLQEGVTRADDLSGESAGPYRRERIRGTRMVPG